MADFSIIAFSVERLLRKRLMRRVSGGSLLLAAQMARVVVSPNSCASVPTARRDD